jgi:hypothetical protein
LAGNGDVNDERESVVAIELVGISRANPTPRKIDGGRSFGPAAGEGKEFAGENAPERAAPDVEE